MVVGFEEEDDEGAIFVVVGALFRLVEEVGEGAGWSEDGVVVVVVVAEWIMVPLPAVEMGREEGREKGEAEGIILVGEVEGTAAAGVWWGTGDVRA